MGNRAATIRRLEELASRSSRGLRR